jgi:hypothetical protein
MKIVEQKVSARGRVRFVFSWTAAGDLLFS